MNTSDNTRQYRTIENTAPNAPLRASALMIVVLCAAAFVCATIGAASAISLNDKSVGNPNPLAYLSKFPLNSILAIGISIIGLTAVFSLRG